MSYDVLQNNWIPTKPAYCVFLRGFIFMSCQIKYIFVFRWNTSFLNTLKKYLINSGHLGFVKFIGFQILGNEFQMYIEYIAAKKMKSDLYKQYLKVILDTFQNG